MRPPWPGWGLLVVTPDSVSSWLLAPGRRTIVGRDARAHLRVAAEGVALRHCVLTVNSAEGAVRVEDIAGEVRLNGLEVSAATPVRSGDELSLGAARLVLLPRAAAALPHLRLATYGELMARLGGELLRARTDRPVGLVLLSSPSLNVAARAALVRRVVEAAAKRECVASWGEFTVDTAVGVLPELSVERLEALLLHLQDVAGPRARLAAAQSLRDGLEAEALIETALQRLWPEQLGFGVGEPLFVEASMVRLAALAEELAARRGAVLAIGEPGCGRATLLAVLARASGAPLTVARATDSAGLEAALRGPPGGLLLVREVEVLGAAGFGALLDRASERSLRVLATSTQALGGARVRLALEVPALRARPADVLPLAEHFLSLGRVVMARARLRLGPDVRQRLGAAEWRGNVRELKNVLLRAARASVHDELGVDDTLPSTALEEAGPLDRRGAVSAAAREAILEALARTRWNVTAAAARLKVPRRTLVHRMARLGLTRPAR
jgi:hypothetical protein